MIDRKSEQLGNLFLFLIIIGGVSCYSRSLGDKYASYALWVNMGFALVGLLVSRRLLRGDIWLLLVTAAWTSFTLLLTQGGFGSVLTLVVPLFMLSVYSHMYINEKSKKLLCLVCVVGIMWILKVSFSYLESYNLALRTNTNPNTLSAYAVFFFMMLFVFSDFSKRGNKILVICTLLAVLYIIFACRCRGSMITLVAFLVLALLPDKLWNTRIILVLAFTVVVIGTLIPFLLLAFYRNGVELELFGKSLYTGREKIWLEMFQQFNNKPTAIFIGLGSKAQLWDRTLNVHNNYFNFIVNFGIIGYVLYFLMLFRFILRAAIAVKNRMVKNALLMFICATFILGFFETTSLNNRLAPFVYFGLLVANNQRFFLRDIKTK